MVQRKEISKSVLKRLPVYLAYLKNMPEDSPPHISATADWTFCLFIIRFKHCNSPSQIVLYLSLQVS